MEAEAAVTSIEAKTEARKKARSALRLVQSDRAREMSAAAAAAFRSLAEFETADIVLAFLSMPGEILTDFLIEGCLREGRRVAVPRIEGNDIAFVPLDGDYRSWPRDRFGIPEPPRESRSLELDELGRSRVLVAAPGLAFDRAGRRLGRGKGYYDRFLASAAKATAAGGGRLTVCGFCYSIQIAETLPTDERDIPVDAIATESGLLRPRAR